MQKKYIGTTTPTTVLFIFCLIILIRILVDILIYTEPKGPTVTIAYMLACKAGYNSMSQRG